MLPLSNALAPLPDLPDLPPLPALDASPRAPVTLPRRAKAAVVVRMMLAAGVDISLADFPEDLQLALTEQMARLEPMDSDTIGAIVEEFLEEIEGGGTDFPRGLEESLAVLEKALSPSLVNRLRRKAGITYRGDPWKRLSSLDNERLAGLLETESIEVGAVVLSKMSVAKAAELLGLIPGERARRITYGISQIGSISPQVVRRIGESLLSQLDTTAEAAFEDAPVARVGEILNRSPARTRDSVLDGLEEADEEFAREVRKAIFTFANIRERVDASDIPKVMRAIDQGALVKVLVGAQGVDREAVDYILDNISQRMADSLRGEAEELGRISDEDSETAMNGIVQGVRELVSGGEIFLIAGDK